jgi:hypothetical protein
MSLINDALKQTKQSQPQITPYQPPSLPPVETTSSGGGNWLAPVLIILLFAATGIFVGLSLSRHSLSVAAASKVKPVTASQRVATKTTQSNTNTLVTDASRPEPKLQGILLTATRPSAIVDGKTVFVGDQVSGLRVVAISKNSVTLRSDTETRVLSLSRW